MKKAVIFIDYEGKYGMPFKGKYDIGKSTDRILKILNKHKLVAVFNVCSQLAVDSPSSIRKIAKAGHEIAMHGFSHEDILQMSYEEFERKLLVGIKQITKVTGKRPVGFRAPFLMAPKFYDKTIYEILARNGFKWVSHREIRFPEEIVLPKYVKNNLWSKIYHALNLVSIKPIYDLTLIFINRNFVLQDKRLKSHITRIKANIDWLVNDRSNLIANKLVDIPVVTPLDCDYFGLPRLQEKIDVDLVKKYISFARYQARKSYKNLNFNLHDWITGTDSKSDELDLILTNIFSDNKLKTVTASQFIRI